MALDNPWVSYVDRSYAQIKQSLLTGLSTNNPEVTDHSESNILVIIISMFAGLCEMLGYYVDNMAREAFIATARKYPSMVKLVKILDYRIKAAYPASVDILFTFNAALTSTGMIPVGTEIQTANNVSFKTIANLSVPLGATNATIGAQQIAFSTAVNLGTTTSAADQTFAIGTDYVDSSSVVVINGITWNPVTTLGLSGPTDQAYIVEIDVDGIAYVVFGDGTNGAIPPSGYQVLASYQTTLGASGNVDENTITTLVSTLTLPGVTSTTCNNPLAASGGSDYEGIESIRKRAPLSIRTLDRAVTKQDYIDIALLYAGVGKADVDFDCGKDVVVYIVPVGGGIAQSPLLIGCKAFMDNRRMLTTFVDVEPAGETPISMLMDVYLMFRADLTQSQTDIENALVEYGSYANQNINKKVNLSDVIAKVDNLSCVDHIDLTGLFSRPYSRPVNHQVPLSWTRATLVACVTKSTWSLQFAGASFIVIRNNQFQGNATIGTLYTDPSGDIEFTILSGAYTIGQEWVFTTYPYGKNIDLDDFSIPNVVTNDLVINLIPTLVPNN